MVERPTKSVSDVEEQRLDIRVELDRLEQIIDDLKVQYEQYFTGLLPLAPDKLHNEVKRTIRYLLKAPFRSSAMNYRLRAIRQRYSTFDTYWKRILKQREDGVYSKDVFKANMRERFALDDVHSTTSQGAAQKSMTSLFNAYRAALEKQTGGKAKVDFESFQKNLVNRAKDFKEKHQGKKLAFQVVVKDGKVTVQARIKE